MEHMRNTHVDKNRTPAVENKSYRVMPNTLDVDLDFNKAGITTERALY